jgi:hypothetical protein
MTAITESPVVILFNPALRSAASKDLPITLYESGAHSAARDTVAAPRGLTRARAAQNCTW